MPARSIDEKDRLAYAARVPMTLEMRDDLAAAADRRGLKLAQFIRLAAAEWLLLHRTEVEISKLHVQSPGLERLL